MEVRITPEMKRMVEPLSSTKRIRYELEIVYAEHKIEREGGKFTEKQRLDWELIIKYRKMRIAIDDYSHEGATLTMKDVLDTTLDYLKSVRGRRIPVSEPSITLDSAWTSSLLSLPAVPLVELPYQGAVQSRTDWNSLRCENWQPPVAAEGEPVLAATVTHRCSGERVDDLRGSYYRCDNDDDPLCPQYRAPAAPAPAGATGALPPADEEDLYA